MKNQTNEAIGISLRDMPMWFGGECIPVLPDKPLQSSIKNMQDHTAGVWFYVLSIGRNKRARSRCLRREGVNNVTKEDGTKSVRRTRF